MELDKELYQRYLIQKTDQQSSETPPVSTRRRLLKDLLRVVKKNKDNWVKAINEDFGNRCEYETRLYEILPVMQSIRFTLHRLKRFAKPIRRRSVVWFRHLRTQLIPQPLGIVGIVVPWNYPIQLSLMPLASALAAGNRVMLKMPAQTPNINKLLKQLLGEIFPMQMVQVVEGDEKLTQNFLNLPFDYLAFTGASKKAYEFLSFIKGHETPKNIPEKLALDRKSPAIMTQDYSLRTATKRILIGKLINAGQTSAAPDYILLPYEAKKLFIEQAKKLFSKIYPDFRNNQDYTSIIDKENFNRLEHLCADAKAKGAKIIPLADIANDKKTRRFTPCLIFDVTQDMLVAKEEIFGPILPVILYEDSFDVIHYINEQPYPLALYLFDKNTLRIRQILLKTISGIVTINDVLQHASEEITTFDHIGKSGINRYYGKAGFDVFTHYKNIYFQTRHIAFSFLNPPFKKLAKAWTKLVLR